MGENSESPEFFGHRLQTLMTCARAEDSTTGLGQTLRTRRPLVGELSVHGVPGPCANSLALTLPEGFQAQGVRKRPMQQVWVSCSGGRTTAAIRTPTAWHPLVDPGRSARGHWFFVRQTVILTLATERRHIRNNMLRISLPLWAGGRYDKREPQPDHAQLGHGSPSRCAPRMHRKRCRSTLSTLSRDALRSIVFSSWGLWHPDPTVARHLSHHWYQKREEGQPSPPIGAR